MLNHSRWTNAQVHVHQLFVSSSMFDMHGILTKKKPRHVHRANVILWLINRNDHQSKFEQLTLEIVYPNMGGSQKRCFWGDTEIDENPWN